MKRVKAILRAQKNSNKFKQTQTNSNEFFELIERCNRKPLGHWGFYSSNPFISLEEMSGNLPSRRITLEP